MNCRRERKRDIVPQRIVVRKGSKSNTRGREYKCNKTGVAVIPDANNKEVGVVDNIDDGASRTDTIITQYPIITNTACVSSTISSQPHNPDLYLQHVPNPPKYSQSTPSQEPN